MEARQSMSLVLRIFLYILIMLLFSQTLRAAKTSVESLFYIAMTQLLVSSFAPQSFEIFNDIHSGLYSLRIGKPLHYIAIYFLRSMSVYIYRLAIFIIAFLLLQRVMPNLLGRIVPTIGSFIFFSVIGGSIYSLLSILIGLASYWAKDVKVFFYLNMTTLFSLGGLIIPLDLYSKTAQKIAFYSPYPYILWYPARAAYLGSFEESWHLLAQGIWFAVLSLCTVVVYHRLNKSLLVHD